MTMHKAIRNVCEMSSRELKSELIDCTNNPVKRHVIKLLINEKYKNHLIRKHQRKMKKEIEQMALLDSIVNNAIEDAPIEQQPIQPIHQPVQEPDQECDQQPDQKLDRPSDGMFAAIDQNDELYDPKFKDVLEKNASNNNMLDRLNSEL